MKLEEKFTKVSTRRDGDLGHTSYFHFVENLRFIDLDNLEKYTIKQLQSIGGIWAIRGAKKPDYIRLIRKNTELLEKIKQDNREWKLVQLGIKTV